MDHDRRKGNTVYRRNSPRLGEGDEQMKITKTSRGFRLAEFVDGNGERCSMQESSAAEQPMLWLGLELAEWKTFEPGVGWKTIPFPSSPPGGSILVSARMHLTQQQVQELLPYLLVFAQTGEMEMPEAKEMAK
jgi:hypothetical protein